MTHPLEELRKAALHRDKESSPRWQAHYDYILAQLLARTAYISEYNLMLGKIRKDELPPLDPKLHKGWRLSAVEKMSAPKEIKEHADDARKLFANGLGGEAKAFYAAKSKAGKNPTVVKAPPCTLFDAVPDEKRGLPD